MAAKPAQLRPHAAPLARQTGQGCDGICVIHSRVVAPCSSVPAQRRRKQEPSSTELINTSLQHLGELKHQYAANVRAAAKSIADSKAHARAEIAAIEAERKCVAFSRVSEFPRVRAQLCRSPTPFCADHCRVLTGAVRVCFLLCACAGE